MKKRLAGLDSIRFISALIVVLGHYGGPPFFENLDESVFLYKAIQALYTCLFNGPAAVIVFFIVSGLVIHYPYFNGKPFRLLEFYGQRYIRIGVPMVVIALIAFYFDRMEDIGVFWSLYAELIYYTLYPVVILLKNRYGLKLQIAATYFIGLAIIFFVPHPDTNAYVDLGNYYTWIIGLPVWLLGVLLAEKVDSTSSLTYNKMLLLRVGIYGLSVLLRIAKFHTDFSNLITLNLFAFVVYFWLMEEARYYRDRQATKVLELGGTWSYSLYICHPLAATFIIFYLPNSLHDPLQWIILFSGALFLSYIFYLAIEKPSHLLAKKIKHRQIPHSVENLTHQ